MPLDRDKKAAWNAAKLAEGREITLPEVQDVSARKRLESDPCAFLSEMFPDKYRYWTATRREIVEEVMYRIRYGGDKAKAMERGSGKTALVEGLVGVYAIVTGMLRYPVLTGSTGEAASGIIGNIKSMWEESQNLLALYPEVAGPIQALDGSPRRGRMQSFRGERTLIEWNKTQLKFPTVRFCQKCLTFAGEIVELDESQRQFICEGCMEPMEHSAASGSGIMAKGMNTAIRGLRKGSQRPDFVLIDDPETRDSAKNDKEIDKRSKIIDNDLAGLGSSEKPVPRLILTTIQNATCLSANYTDRAKKPSWEGDRRGLVIRWPFAKKEWEHYCELRIEGQQYRGDTKGREAHAYYLANRAAMDEGAIVSDDLRYDKTMLPDGTRVAESTIEQVHQEACDKGWEYVLCELQNNPPDAEETKDGDEITEGVVRGVSTAYVGRLTGRPKGEVPESCLGLTTFIDCGKRKLTYAVQAWNDDQRSTVIDYEHVPTTMPDVVGEGEAVKSALIDLYERFKAEPYSTADGLVVESETMVDSGDFTDDVKAAVAEINRRIRDTGGRPWRISKGASRPVKDPKHFEQSRDGGLIFVLMDADYWKGEIHESFLMKPIDESGYHARGATRIFGSDHRDHKEFAAEVVAEREVTEFVEGKGLKQGFVAFKRANHFLDAMYGGRCLAAVCKLLEGRSIRPLKPRIEATPAPEISESPLFRAENVSRLGLGGRPVLRPGGN